MVKKPAVQSGPREQISQRAGVQSSDKQGSWGQLGFMGWAMEVSPVTGNPAVPAKSRPRS